MQLLAQPERFKSHAASAELFLPARLLAKIRKDQKTGCWIWTGASGFHPNYRQHRYGQIVRWENGRRTMTSAHRFAYICVFGPIPDEMDVDHLCHNKLCVNPAHLEAVSHRENMRRRKGVKP